MFMGYKKVEYSLRPYHPLFIGPSSAKHIRRRAECRRYIEKYRTPKWSMWPGHPLFIGPRMPPDVRARLKASQYAEKNREQIKVKSRIRWAENREKYRRNKREHYAKNRDEILKKQTVYVLDRLQRDPLFAMTNRLRCRVRMALKNSGVRKSARTMDLIGCTAEECRDHLEKQFLPGMTWQNNTHQGWNIDHIIPCAAFDLKDPDHQRMCFHYTNLRPMWASDNIRKGDKLTPEAIALIVTSKETVETDVLPVYIDRAG